MEGEKQTGNDLQRQSTTPYVDKRSFGEKIIVGVIIITAFFAVGIGYYQMSSSIKSPFADILKFNQANKDCIGGDCALEAQILLVLEQQQTDTDSDGLSDYDEVNVYGTSPYLEDTDSDGFTDKQEVDQGYDPNCVGNDCHDGNDVSDDFNLVDVQTLMSGQSDSNTLRSLLSQRGLPDNILGAISDEELMLVYQQSLSNQDTSSITTGSDLDTSGINTGSIDSLRNLSGAEIRTLLINQGAPAEILDQISDGDLKAMFISQLNAKTNL